MGLIGVAIRLVFCVLLKTLPYGGTHIPWFLNYSVSYISELLVLCQTILIITSVDCIFVGLCVHITYHLKFLAKEIAETLFSGRNDLSVLTKYNDYVSRHRYLLV